MKHAIALLINDIHISHDNINEFELNWKEALQVAHDYNTGDIIVGGDLFQSRAAQSLRVLMAARKALKTATNRGFKVYLMNGNHDLVDQNMVEGYCHIFSGYNDIRVIDQYDALSFGGVQLCLMAYLPENGPTIKTVLGMFKDMPTNEECCKILYCHEGIGYNQDKEISPDNFKFFDKVLVGHYHDRSISGNIEYIGASRQHNFGEDVHKGYTILFNDGSTEFVENKVNRRYQTIYKSYDEMVDCPEKLDETDNCSFRLVLTCTPAQAETIKKQDYLNAGFKKVEIVTEDETQVQVNAVEAIHSRYDKCGIKKAYTTFCEKNEIPSESGLNYLDKI